MQRVRIRSNIGATLKAVGEWNEGMSDRIARGLQRGMLHAAGITQTKFLQGPRPKILGEVTTSLRRSITTRVMQIDNGVRGEIGTNIPYAAYHEFGFKGPQRVKGHERIATISRGGEQILYTRRLLSSLGQFKRYQVRDTRGRVVGWKRRVTPEMLKGAGFGAGTIKIKGYTRNVDYLGRPFLRPSLAEALPYIVDQVALEANKQT
jgi:phage gpG-like protein